MNIVSGRSTAPRPVCRPVPPELPWAPRPKAHSLEERRRGLLNTWPELRLTHLSEIKTETHQREKSLFSIQKKKINKCHFMWSSSVSLKLMLLLHKELRMLLLYSDRSKPLQCRKASGEGLWKLLCFYYALRIDFFWLLDWEAVTVVTSSRRVGRGRALENHIRAPKSALVRHGSGRVFYFFCISPLFVHSLARFYLDRSNCMTRVFDPFGNGAQITALLRHFWSVSRCVCVFVWEERLENRNTPALSEPLYIDSRWWIRNVLF